jgi:carboxyl-terminal processing protease
VVGEDSFGKGLVQTVFPISQNMAFALTIAKYYTPSGRSIQNVGITPDIEVKLPKTKESKNGESGHIIVREKDLDRHLGNDSAKEQDKDKSKKKSSDGEEDLIMESIPKDDKEDVQLQKAIEILKTGDIFKNVLPAKQEKAS